jgi:hypothetical protein
VSYLSTLQSLERLLESFLERVVAAKEPRLRVLDGINRLDDIARASLVGDNITDRLGDWFAEHNGWLAKNGLRTADVRRINEMLTEIKQALSKSGSSTPAVNKIRREIDRWTERAESPSGKLVLKRGRETVVTTDGDTLTTFGALLERMVGLYADVSGGQPHILSVLDDLLTSAGESKNKEALLLSACIIYYLKLNGYKIEPYVKRLKTAENNFRDDKRYAQRV